VASKGLQVVVKFPPEVGAEYQGRSLLLLEKYLRQSSGQDIRVVKDLMGDDSKLRRFMTIKQREAL